MLSCRWSGIKTSIIYKFLRNVIPISVAIKEMSLIFTAFFLIIEKNI